MTINEESMKEADSLKNQGNSELKQNNFEKAIGFYTEAIKLNPTNSIYFSNRAQAQIKLENYGLAINDANESIKLNKDYLKGYYRRAVAYSAILEYKKSLNDANLVLSRAPKDAGCLSLKKELTRIITQLKFEKAIETDENKSRFNAQEIADSFIEASYEGPELKIEKIEGAKERKEDYLKVDMTRGYIDKMIETFKDGGKLPKKHVMAILFKANQLLLNDNSLVEIGLSRGITSGKEYQDDKVKKITVCGDTHGQFFDVLNLFKLFGDANNEHIYLFNGDFVDRGSWSCEVALLFLSLKVLYPTRLYLNRGNHETNDMNKVYGFEDECKYKYGLKIFKLFEELFNSLPYATLIGQEYLVMHGGLFSDDDTTLDDIRDIKRVYNRQPPKEGVQMELLWTDPQVEKGRSQSKRGIGMQFGPDVTKRFCEKNGIKKIIRSHEVRENGYELEHDGQLITVFSAPNYCDVQGNLGAVINFTLNDKEEYELEFQTFKEVPHPNLPPMHYSKGNMGF